MRGQRQRRYCKWNGQRERQSPSTCRVSELPDNDKPLWTVCERVCLLSPAMLMEHHLRMFWIWCSSLSILIRWRYANPWITFFKYLLFPLFAPFLQLFVEFILLNLLAFYLPQRYKWNQKSWSAWNYRHYHDGSCRRLGSTPRTQQSSSPMPQGLSQR